MALSSNRAVSFRNLVFFFSGLFGVYLISTTLVNANTSDNGQQDISEQINARHNQGSQPQLITRIDPRYPANEARASLQGWGEFFIIIDEKGNVDDVFLLRSSGRNAFDNSTRKALRKWKYEALPKGEQRTRSNKLQIDFSLQNLQRSLSSDFNKAYADINTLIQAGKYAEALQQSNKALKGKDYHQNELTLFTSLIAKLHLQLGQPYQSALAYEDVMSWRHTSNIKRDFFVTHARELLPIYISINQFKKAQELYEWIALQSPELVSDLQGAMEQVTAMNDAQEAIVNSLFMFDRELAYHSLLRSVFTVQNVQGDIDEIRLLCHQHTQLIELNTSYVTEPTWGKCYVLATGEAGTSMQIIESQSST
jgi:protein TonB